MKNEPQLSAEMEKRLKKLFYKEYLVKSDPEDYIHEGLDSSQQYSHLKAFLATALEEQRNDIKTAWRNLHIFGAASVGSAQGLIIKNPWGETDSCQVDREAFRRFIDILNGKEANE